MNSTLNRDDINRTISGAMYHQFPGTLTIICCLVLVGGFVVVGEAHCADPAQFDEGVGRTEAHEDAVRKVWPLAAYLQRYKLNAGVLQAESSAVEAAYMKGQAETMAAFDEAQHGAVERHQAEVESLKAALAAATAVSTVDTHFPPEMPSDPAEPVDQAPSVAPHFLDSLAAAAPQPGNAAN